jgi:enoyl-CoA hydratase/carnithine racemase
MAFETILQEQRDDVVVLTLNRPDRLNAWTPLMSAELCEAIEAADAERSVGAVVVTGAGRAFCAGADIAAVFDAQLQGDSDAAIPQGRDWIGLIRSTKPIVAAVNGPVIGMGLTMILPFDRIVVARGAKLSVRFVKMGLVPELASSLFLPMRCGWGVASDLMLSGRTIEADEALALRIVDEVVEPESVLDVAIERARSYGENPTPQLRWIKQLLTANANETDPHAAQRRELESLAQAYATAEHKEAVAAFLEKRPPVFR